MVVNIPTNIGNFAAHITKFQKLAKFDIAVILNT